MTNMSPTCGVNESPTDFKSSEKSKEVVAVNNLLYLVSAETCSHKTADSVNIAIFCEENIHSIWLISTLWSILQSRSQVKDRTDHK